jgi:hypothetical protein
MERTYGSMVFSSQVIRNDTDGLLGLELFAEARGDIRRVARVVYWDAEGQYAVETMGEVPLKILEELIREAKQVVRV